MGKGEKMKIITAKCSSCGYTAQIDVDEKECKQLMNDDIYKHFPFWPLIPNSLLCVHCNRTVYWESKIEKEEKKDD